MTSKELAFKIAAYIIRHNGSSYTAIKNRAVELGISLADLEDALVELHKNPMCHRTMAGGDVQYAMKSVVKKPTTSISHIEWLKKNNENGHPNYPIMTEENNGNGFDIDFSWLFLKPEDVDKYWAQVRGVAYVPKKRYVRG